MQIGSLGLSKIKEERYQYISNLFSGTGNPQYGNHTLNVGRVYTEERNKKVSEAVKEWAKTHREHYFKMGVFGALKARKRGLSGIPTGLEIIMEKALRKYKIRYLGDSEEFQFSPDAVQLGEEFQVCLNDFCKTDTSSSTVLYTTKEIR